MRRLDDEWEAHTHEVRRHRRCQCRKSSITASLALLATSVAMVAGLMAWGTGYSLNSEGYNFMSGELQRTLVSSMTQSLYQSFILPTVNIQVLEERTRLLMQTNGYSIGIEDLRSVVVLNETLRLMWTFVTQSRQNIYLGLADGAFYGYLRPGVSNSTLLKGDFTGLSATVNTTTLERTLLSTDYYGFPVGSPVKVDTFNATTRLWYELASATSNFSVTKPYVFATTKRIGITFAIPLLEDLQPPGFNSLAPVNTEPNGPFIIPRIPIAVAGSDVELIEISEFMSLLPLNGGRAWLFDGLGALMLGTSNLTTPMVGPGGEQLHVPEVDDIVINNTMAQILKQDGIAVDDYLQYARITPFFNQYIRVDDGNGTYIVSCEALFTVSNSKWFFVLAVPKSTYFYQAYLSNIVSLLVLFLVLIPGLALVSAIFSHYWFSLPAIRLSEGMASIASFLPADRDLAALDAVTRDSHISEIYSMQRSFLSMRKALAGFEKFAPTHICRTLLTENIEAKLGVETREASCFFSDIVGFTSISEKEDPETLISALAEYFNEVTDIIQDRHGIVGDFIGDAVFAFWNCPEYVPNHAYLACEAAVVQQERLVELRSKWKSKGMPPFRVRMGINSGMVLSGNVGADQRMKYTLIGDTVNLASRLEGLGKQYHVELIVSRDTYEQPLVRDSFCSRALDVVRVVGKDDSTTILTLTGWRKDASPEQLQMEALSWQMVELYQARQFECCLKILDQMCALVTEESRFSVELMRYRVFTFVRDGIPEGFNGSTKMCEK